MKKLLIYVCILGATSLVNTACTQDMESISSSEKSKLIVDLGADVSFKSSNTRSIDESTYKDISNYTVKLEKTAGNQLIHSDLYSNWDLAYEVEPGVEYRLSASYGEAVPASYDQLLVSGSETFTVQSGSTKTVSFQCKPQAAKVSVAYSEDFSSYFSDCIVSIKTKHLDEAWEMSKTDAGKELYLKTGDTGTDVTLSFTITDLEGETVTIEKEDFETTKTITLKPGVAYTLTIKPNQIDVDGGKLGMDITVDDGVAEDDVTITVPGEFMPGATE